MRREKKPIFWRILPLFNLTIAHTISVHDCHSVNIPRLAF